MEIRLETDEMLKIIVDGACEFNICGERNEEGTMILNTEYDEETCKHDWEIFCCTMGCHAGDCNHRGRLCHKCRIDRCDAKCVDCESEGIK